MCDAGERGDCARGELLNLDWSAISQGDKLGIVLVVLIAAGWLWQITHADQDEEEEEELDDQEEDRTMTTFEIQLNVALADSRIRIRAADYDYGDNFTDFNDDDNNIVLSVQTKLVVWIKDLELAEPKEKGQAA